MQEHVLNFIQKIKPIAQKVEAQEGFHYRFIMAQIALETGWLRRISKDCETGEDSKNLFNIKGEYQGQSVRVKTQEYFNGQNPVVVYDKFRKYPTYEESILDWIRLLKTPRYQRAYAVRRDLEKLAYAIYECGYATDPKYPEKILSVAKTIQEHEKELDVFVHVVVPGDTLWTIGRRYGVAVEELVQLNQLTSPDRIYPGQRLVIPEKVHIVREGETIWDILNQYNVSLENVIQANPHLIAPGLKLVIPR